MVAYAGSSAALRQVPHEEINDHLPQITMRWVDWKWPPPQPVTRRHGRYPRLADAALAPRRLGSILGVACGLFDGLAHEPWRHSVQPVGVAVPARSGRSQTISRPGDDLSLQESGGGSPPELPVTSDRPAVCLPG